jgi:hypothetical protein
MEPGFPSTLCTEYMVDNIKVRATTRFPIPPNYSGESINVKINIKEMKKTNTPYKEFIFDANFDGFNPIPYSINIYTDINTKEVFCDVIYDRIKYIALAKFPIDSDNICKAYLSLKGSNKDPRVHEYHERLQERRDLIARNEGILK